MSEDHVPTGDYSIEPDDLTFFLVAIPEHPDAGYRAMVRYAGDARSKKGGWAVNELTASSMFKATLSQLGYGDRKKAHQKPMIYSDAIVNTVSDVANIRHRGDSGAGRMSEFQHFLEFYIADLRRTLTPDQLQELSTSFRDALDFSEEPARTGPSYSQAPGNQEPSQRQ